MENLNDTPARYEENQLYLKDPTNPAAKPYSRAQKEANEVHKRRTTLYHKTEGRRVFNHDEVEDMMAQGWSDTPNLKIVKSEEVESTPLIEALRKEAKDMGIKIDKRWGEERLKKEILSV